MLKTRQGQKNVMQGIVIEDNDKDTLALDASPEVLISVNRKIIGKRVRRSPSPV